MATEYPVLTCASRDDDRDGVSAGVLFSSPLPYTFPTVCTPSIPSPCPRRTSVSSVVPACRQIYARCRGGGRDERPRSRARTRRPDRTTIRIFLNIHCAASGTARRHVRPTVRPVHDNALVRIHVNARVCAYTTVCYLPQHSLIIIRIHRHHFGSIILL